jgi:hypothetical protein
MDIPLSVHSKYDIVTSLRFEALATEINRRAEQGGLSLIGQPFVSGQYVCQAIVIYTPVKAAGN